MYARSNGAGGCYEPSFLYMYIDTYEDLRHFPTSLDDERTEALFLHEYIHFLQDLTTVYSYAQTCTFVDQLKWAVAENRKKNDIKVPMDPEKATQLHIAENEKVRLLTVGGGAVPEMKIASISKLEIKSEELMIDDIIKNVPLKFVMHFTDQSNNNQSLVIGSNIIMESMAYLIEYKLYGNILGEPDDIPYNVIRKLVQYDCPNYIDDDSLIMLCDVSLMHPFPGIALSNILSVLKMSEKCLSPEDIFNLGVSKRILAQSGVFEQWPIVISNHHKMAKKQLMDYFTLNYWKENKDVVEIIFDRALDLRIKNPILFLDIANGGRVRSNTLFCSIYSQIGFMCILTGNHRVYSLPPSGYNGVLEEDLFIALHQCFRILLRNDLYTSYGTKHCELFERCHQSYVEQKLDEKGLPDLTASKDDFCNHYPWKQTSKEALPKCPFGRLWFTYGLADKELVEVQV